MGQIRVAFVILASAAVAGCAGPIPEEPVVSGVDTAALAELVIGAESICEQHQGSVAAMSDGSGVPIFDQVRALGSLELSGALGSPAHELWWQRYLATRRTSVLLVLDAARSSALPAQQEDAVAWRASASAFEDSMEMIGDEAEKEVDTMFAAATAAEMEFSGGGSRLLGEVERRLAAAIGIASCNRPVLDGRLEEQVGDSSELERLDEMADVLVGPSLATGSPSTP